MTTLTEKVASALVALGSRSPAGYAIALDIALSTPGYLFQTYPEAWLNEYSAKGYVLRDATVIWGMQNQGRTRWSDLSGNGADEVFDAAALYGVRFGVVFAREINGQKTIASFSRPDREFTDAEMDDLSDLLEDLGLLLSGEEAPDLEEIRKIRAISVAMSRGQ